MISKETIFLTISAIAGIGFIILSFYVKRHEKSTRSDLFFFTLLFLSINVFSYFFELISKDLAVMIFWNKVFYTSLILYLNLWLLFSIEYAYENTVLSRRFKPFFILIAIIPAISIFFLVYTVDGFFYSYIGTKPVGSLTAVKVKSGFLYWIHSVYSWWLVIATMVLILIKISRLGRMYRLQAMAILIGILTPMLYNLTTHILFFIIKIPPIPFKLTQLMYIVTAITFTWGIFGERFLDIVPIARRIVFDNVEDLIFVFNLESRVIDSNNSARNFIRKGIINFRTDNINGRSIAEIFKQHPKMLDIINSRQEGNYEVLFQHGDISKIFDVSLSSIYGNKKSRIGYVAILRDITEIRTAQERSEKLLLNILPKDVAEELKSKGKSPARYFKEVTVMFTDFKDFSSVAETLSPHELVFEIDTCFKVFDQIISKYGIEKIKTIGDSYMAAGGLGTERSSTAEDVVNAAIEMQSFILSRKSELLNESKQFFEMRVGIHTGPVIAGIVGIKKFQYDIWGNTVNIASRMESSGFIEKVNISQSTYELIKDVDEFDFERRGKINAKNIGLIEMYYVCKKIKIDPTIIGLST